MKTNFKSSWITVLIGVAAIGFGIYSYFNTEKFMENALETKGVVVDVYVREPSFSDEKKKSSKPEYCPIVEFVTESGDTVEFKSINGSTSFDYYKDGKEVDIIYNPDNPVEARIKLKSGNNNQPYLIGGGGLLFIVIGIFGALKKKKVSQA